ncbi:MAG: type II toxin-antitoxin system VapC family toxin [Burkholderiales bacterium]
MIICDTHVLIFDALAPARLSAKARRRLKDGEASGQLACADISLWEIAMLIAKGRLQVAEEPGAFIQTVIDARGYRVLPITPEIAARSQSADITPKDPADRLIAATALTAGAELLSADDAMKKIPTLKLTW